MNYIGCSGFYEHTHASLQDKWTGLLFQLPSFFKYSDENLQKVLWTIDRRFVNEVEFRLVRWWCDEVKIALKEANIVMAGVSILLKSVDNQIPDDVLINNDDTVYYGIRGMPKMFKLEYCEDEQTALAKKFEDFKGQRYVFFNNTFGIAGIKNALFLHQLLNNQTRKRITIFIKLSSF